MLLLVWWGAYESGRWGAATLPSPLEVMRALVHDLFTGTAATGTMALALQRSIIRLIVGMGVAVIIGTLIGVMMAASVFVQRSIGSLMTGLQALPSISWLPLALLWFGLNERAIIFVVIIGSIPAVALATTASIRLVPPLLIRSGRTMGARGWTLYRNVVMPAAVPGYIGGLQQAWALAWRALMAGELIATGAAGLGHFQEVARQRFDVPTVMAVMVMIIIIGMLVDFGFSLIDRRVREKRGLVLSI
jgi:NitT/TauT family transport system permease protein